MNRFHPVAISVKEWEEIAKLDQVLEGWGFDGADAPIRLAAAIYGVRFDFVSDGPGYVGPLYLLQGAGSPDTPPLALVHQNGQLVTATNDPGTPDQWAAYFSEQTVPITGLPTENSDGLSAR